MSFRLFYMWWFVLDSFHADDQNFLFWCLFSFIRSRRRFLEIFIFLTPDPGAVIRCICVVETAALVKILSPLLFLHNEHHLWNRESIRNKLWRAAAVSGNFFKWLRKWEWMKLVELPAGVILKPTKAVMGNV